MSSIHKIDDHEASLEYWGTNLFSQHMTEFTSYVLDKVVIKYEVDWL